MIILMIVILVKLLKKMQKCKSQIAKSIVLLFDLNKPCWLAY